MRHLPPYPWNIPCVILIGMASWAAGCATPGQESQASRDRLNCAYDAQVKYHITWAQAVKRCTR